VAGRSVAGAQHRNVVGKSAVVGKRGKSASDYSRKSGAENYKAKSSMTAKKKLLIGIAAGVVALLATAAVAFGIYYNDLSKSFTIDDPNRLDNLNEVLSVPAPNEPFYTLLLGSDSRDPENTAGSRSDTIMLARIDPTVPQVTILSVNRDTKIELAGHGTQKINAAYAFKQEAGAVDAVEKLCNVDIAHYAEINFSGVIDLVDKIGGVTVNVPLACEYNGEKLAAGKQHINGKQALLLSRCRKFANPDYQRVVNQRILLQAVAKKVLSMPATELPGLLQSLATTVKTDLKVPEIVGIMQSLQGIDDDHIYMATLPSDSKMINGLSYVVVREAELKTMMDRVKKGLTPIDPKNPPGGSQQYVTGDDSVTGNISTEKPSTSSSSTSSKKTS
jgi:LCP family protein required for cell wall assembly